ncbi:MAG: DsbE family thiol:disulfide interchange protein [Sphingomonas sp.]|nr:DsbE family thiol:disulfide interchange protein [Sphingomonas sp.]
MNRWLRLVPAVLLALVVAALVWRLANPQDTTVRSRLAGKPVPAFALPAAVPGKPGLASAELANGQPRLLNLFASWCVPCIAEAPMLSELERRGVAIDAIAIRDRPEDVAKFLADHGDPFKRIGSDDNSRVQLALGSSGVPESFVVDGRGVIRYQHIGPISADQMPLILAELEKAR